MERSRDMLQGKVVLVTGGRRGAAATSLWRRPVATGGHAAANADSVADPAGAERMIACALEAFGRIDGVVNNAGILRDRFFHKMSVDDWDAVLKVHLYGSFHISRAAARYFKEQASGSFVHMTSTSGLIGNLGQANYAAAKLGLVALSKSIALDMLKFGVRSNCIAPFAWSRMTGAIPADTTEERARVERFKQMTPAKIAPLAVYLLSDAARARSTARSSAAQQRARHQPAAAGPVGASRRRVDAGVDRRPRHARTARRARAARALGRRLRLGPGLKARRPCARRSSARRHARRSARRSRAPSAPRTAARSALT
jgi:NAD(P)-dependent dehydrogenase (short-subunit alcohol dehydrogenase family)